MKILLKKMKNYLLDKVKTNVIKEGTKKILLVLIFGMALGAALNGVYHGERIDKLNESILEFNIAVEKNFQ